MPSVHSDLDNHEIANAVAINEIYSRQYLTNNHSNYAIILIEFL